MASFEAYKQDRESSNMELDALLAELEQLGSSLDSPSMSDQLLLGMPTLGSSTKRSGQSQPQPSSSSVHYAHSPATTSSSTITRLQGVGSSIGSSSACSSPDGDSAYGEGSSTEGKEACRHSAVSSSDSCRQSLHTPSPSQVSPGVQSHPPEEESKEAKIRIALQKMKEANITRIFVKFFVEDGAPLQMLVDERWSVAETMKQLAEKHHLALAEDHCLVEEFPELYIKRIYEDHENLVENIKMWVDGSPNKIYLTRRPEKYSFIDRPEVYLVTEKTTDMDVPKGEHWPLEVKRQFVEDFFSREAFVPPELEGWLHVKGDGKKVWKKCFFVLRQSGLYYSPKGKKTSKDLQCLMNFHSNQVYTGFDWKKKYKAPTEFGISLKLTQLQMKRSSYIKYICAEDEVTYRKWLTALRIAKNGVQLYENYVNATERRLATMAATAPRRVDVPRVESRLSTRPDYAASVSSSSSRHDALSLGGSSSTHNYPHSLTPPHNGRTREQLHIECSQHSLHSQHSANHSGSAMSIGTPSTVESVNMRMMEMDEQLTGTIKRAPAEVTDVIRRSASSCVEEEDSDEETLPAPPTSHPSTTVHPPSPLVTTPHPSSRSPLPPPKPPLLLSSPVHNVVGGPPPPPVRQTPVKDEYACIQKRPPPPAPPKRSEGTRLTGGAVSSPSAATVSLPPLTPHMSAELEAALGRRRQKIGQAN